MNKIDFNKTDKSVGILDVPWINNFGAVLISYALQHVTMELGYNPEIINYVHIKKIPIKSRIKNKLYSTLRSGIRFIKKILGTAKSNTAPAKKICNAQMPDNFGDFKRKHLRYSKPFSYITQKDFPIYARYIVGSDVVWKPARIKSEEKKLYFLKFAPKQSVKIAYAASIGTNDKELLKSIKGIFRRNINRYDFISLREKESAEFVSQFTNKNVETVIDPTLLLKRDIYDRLEKEATNKIKDKYIYLYNLSDNDDIIKFAEQQAEKLSCKIVYYGFKNYPGREKYLLEFTRFDGPAEFLNRIKEAEMVITDSFHGTVFSVMFHKSFYTFARDNINVRMQNLLNIIDLPDRFIEEYDENQTYPDEKIDFNKVDKVIEAEREKGISFLKTALSSEIKKQVKGLVVTKEENCCGCEACAQICPVKCIDIKINTKGMSEPVVDRKRCINCDACEHVCPVINSHYKSDQNRFFACTNMDAVAAKSTSGGMFLAFSKKIFAERGVVYGAAFDKDMNLRHMPAYNLSEIVPMQGSKYIQSKIGDTYAEIKKDLNNDKKVMFVGTPCQSAALNRYLKKEYDNLLIADLVCMGVPGHGIWNKHLNELPKKIVDASFREKGNRWIRGNNNMHYFYSDGSNEIIPAHEDNYYHCFLQGLSQREACLSCRFKEYRSGSDITLGDFWGVENFKKDLYSPKGVSLVITHTSKGLDYLESISGNIVINEISEEEAVKENQRILTPMFRSGARDKFFERLERNTLRDSADGL